MSLLDTLKGFFGASGGEEGPSSSLHVIETSRVTSRNGGRDRLSPREQVGLLQQLAGFADREKIRACVILEGRPLREAADQSSYKGIQVFYGEQSEEVARIALDLVRKNRDALLVTQNRDLEGKASAAGARTMRTSTLRKALEENGGRSDNGKSGSGRGRRRSRGGRRSGGGGGDRQPSAKQKQPQQQEKPKEQPARDAKDGVSDLIDLV